MRELKFRAWDNKNNNWLTDKDNVFLNEEGDAFLLVRGAASDYHSGVDVAINFYIGLKDRNDKEIYGGDICRILYTDWPSRTDHSISLEDYKKSISHIGVVEYTESARFELKMYSKKYGEFSYSSIHPGTHGEIEVIGNIYEHPQLTEKQPA